MCCATDKLQCFVIAITLKYQEKCTQLVCCYILFYKYIISQKLNMFP